MARAAPAVQSPVAAPRANRAVLASTFTAASVESVVRIAADGFCRARVGPNRQTCL